MAISFLMNEKSRYMDNVSKNFIYMKCIYSNNHKRKTTNSTWIIDFSFFLISTEYYFVFHRLHTSTLHNKKETGIKCF
jgi:hypothetical protein